MSSGAERIAALFRDFTTSAFRLELRQTYKIPEEQERLAGYLAGKPKPIVDAPWRRAVKAKTGAGASMLRAKVVRRPLTDYTRFLMAWGIPDNIEAGEQYRIVDDTDRRLDLPDHDFWFFDDEYVVRLDFASDGTFLGRDLVEDPDLGRYRAWRDEVSSHGVPFGEWTAGAGPAG
ncbi:hypothetical protein VA596_29240 [Amycolatopsis sp., V23-08]|uniref:DUF6879 domain-containing protein n=1 Tax=Amycolatopsis heterodermiae TaxID=3110235 RepID=A0ABU5RCS3_9PSEU|nr:DUF6879 family protein [Amycolatopsis sp., V23-08]MEA5363650.1 hypothetical protein [Amycolatopsis sp., V23-08]